MSTVVLYCWCHSDSASVRLYFTILMHDEVYESDINSVSKIVTLKEDMCHTLQNTGCWFEFQVAE